MESIRASTSLPRGVSNGFTLIELVIVIVILGVLAAVALPRFVDLSDEAKQAQVDGLAGAINSTSIVNLAACQAGNDSCVAVPITSSSGAECGFNPDRAVGRLIRGTNLFRIPADVPASEGWTVNNNPNRPFRARIIIFGTGNTARASQECFIGRR